MAELHELEELVRKAEEDISCAATRDACEQLRIQYLGRKSPMVQAVRSIGTLPAERRREEGAKLNALKVRLEKLLDAREKSFAGGSGGAGLDVTLPGRGIQPGHAHPLTLVTREVLDILRSIGFEEVSGPEVDTDEHNFVVLNTPVDHPARDMQATFYLGKELLLRTQTSAVWAHAMRNRKPPLRIVSPGRVFRRDAVDASHSPVFHQIEGLWVDEKCSFSDLKGVLEAFLGKFFGPKTKVRFAPSYFPFTEPSAEVSIQCVVCGGTGCRTCGHAGWLEILGSGMVNPKVLDMVGYDREKYRGFAFGVGVERLVMLKYGMTDMRMLYENDLRVLAQVR